MEIWSLLGQSKFEGLTIFQNVNHEGVYTVLVTVAHQKCPVERVCKGVYISEAEIYALVIKDQWGERIQILKFSTYYETAKFTGDQSELLGKLK